MESQLAAYRSRKAKEFSQKSTPPSGISTLWSRRPVNQNGDISDDGENKTTRANTGAEMTHPVPQHPVKETKTQYFDEGGTLGDGTTPKLLHRPWVMRALKFILWLILWGLFIEIGFGAVFFVISLLVSVYFNTRTGSDPSNGPSAYSVFNPDCERLDGTFTSEQFERELRFGAGSVR